MKNVMKLEKRDLKLLGEFVAKCHPKLELNYACVGRGGLFATDSYKAIMFHCPELMMDDILVHKKLLKGFEGMMKKDDVANLLVDGDKTCLEFNGTALFLNTAIFEHLYPASHPMLDRVIDHYFRITDLGDIGFELSERFCFIDSFHLFPLVAHSGCNWYDVFYTPMSEKDMGMVKIIATKIIDEEEVIFYTCVIMGREFKSKAIVLQD